MLAARAKAVVGDGALGRHWACSVRANRARRLPHFEKGKKDFAPVLDGAGDPVYLKTLTAVADFELLATAAALEQVAGHASAPCLAVMNTNCPVTPITALDHLSVVDSNSSHWTVVPA